MSKLDADLLRLAAEEQAASTPSPLADPGVRRAMLREVGAIATAWAEAERTVRRQIVEHLATAARLAPAAEPRFDWRSVGQLQQVL